MDKNQEKYSVNAEKILRAIDNTGVRTFMYYSQTKSIIIPDRTCAAYQCKPVYTDMPDSFADDFVHMDDYLQFKEMYYSIDRGEETATAIFHSKDMSFCCQVTLTTVSWTEDGRPNEAFGIIENKSDADKNRRLVKQMQTEIAYGVKEDDDVREAVGLIAGAISETYITIYHIWLEDLTYICFQEEMTELKQEIGTRGPCDFDGINMYIDNCVEPAYRTALREFFDLNKLADKLQDADSISCVYRRRQFGWTKAQYIVAKRNEEGRVTNLIFAVSDMNEEIERDEKEKKALFEIQHDPLTGVFNRKGFEQIISAYVAQEEKRGFAIIDIDNFKPLNDTYGHELGDKVLVSVASHLKGAFRNADRVFRLGGDEFAVLFNSCDESAWDSICTKIANIHNSLKDMFGEYQDISITLSVGLCFFEGKFRDEIFSLADKALYETKQDGRGGCTLIAGDETILRRWHDDNLSIRFQGVLEYNNTGLFSMEIPFDTSRARRMICGEAAKLLLGIEADATPEECYRIWEDGVASSYLETVTDAKETMIKGKHVECTYIWNHPKLGRIFVRSGGYGRVKNDKNVFYGFHHALKDTEIIERRDDKEAVIAALSDVYVALYYINLEEDTFSTFKIAPGEDYLQMQDRRASEITVDFAKTLVESEDYEEMAKFMELSTLSRRMGRQKHLDCNYRSTILKGWCQARFIPIKRNLQGELTHVLFAVIALDDINTDMHKLGEYNSKSLAALFDNVPGGIVMFEWDGSYLKTVHISDYYKKEYAHVFLDSSGAERDGLNFSCIHPDDVEGLKAACKEMIYESHSLKYDYRVINKYGNHYNWVRADIVSEIQPGGNILFYAVYTDISKQKIAEQRLEKSNASITAALGVSDHFSYEYDPVAHTSTCFLDDANGYELDKVITDYPECFRQSDFMHPDDVEHFIATAHSIDEGAASAHCEVRVNKAGKQHWHSCTFNTYFDSEKERNVALLTVVDVTLRKAMLMDYENRIESLIGMVEDSLVVGQFNLTNNTVKGFKAVEEMEPFVRNVRTFEERMMNACDCVVGEESRKKYRRLFARDNLLKLADKGQMQVRMEYRFKIPGRHTVWLETGVSMIKNPVTDEIIGISYSKNIQDARMGKLLLEKVFEQDYLKMAVVLADTEEFYVLDKDEKKEASSIDSRYDFWGHLAAAVGPLMEITEQQICEELNKDDILACLRNDQEFIYAFDSRYFSDYGRLELKFSNLLPSQNIVLVSLRNITDDMLMEKLIYDSEHDDLTGLYNRKTVFARSRGMLEAYPEEQFVMAHVDMKHFHLYNTFFGDTAGDILLCYIAKLLREMDKDYDHWVYGRIEADVFCAVFPYNPEKYSGHLEMAMKSLENYRSDFRIEPVVGLYFVTDRNMPMEAMFARANMASKHVKSGMPDFTAVYNDEMERRLTAEQRIVNEMQMALEQEQFKVYLQPKYSLVTGLPTGAEALVRWVHPERGVILPGRYIPVFENNGFIAELDRYMWEQVCRLLRRWLDEGRNTMPVSVNVSRISMFNPTTVQFLKDLIEKYKLKPHYLELELTESACIESPDEIKKQMEDLRQAGFKILMDDFGSGYSSLNTLRELPVDVLKLDRKLISSSATDARSGAVLSSIIGMSRLLNLVVVAEGVETCEQADYLRSIDGEFAQGFLMARPMPVSEYEEIILVEEPEKKGLMTNKKHRE